jgi:hypothetical protein
MTKGKHRKFLFDIDGEEEGKIKENCFEPIDGQQEEEGADLDVRRRSRWDATAQEALHELADQIPTGGRQTARLIFHLSKRMAKVISPIESIGKKQKNCFSSI